VRPTALTSSPSNFRSGTLVLLVIDAAHRKQTDGAGEPLNPPVPG
jgi:hypothetical protein